MDTVVNVGKRNWEVNVQKTIYETRCRCTLDNLREMTANTRKTGYIIYFTICYVVLFLFGVTIPLLNDKIFMAITVLVILVMAGIFFYMMPRLNAKKQYEAYKRMCKGEELLVKVLIFEDKIENVDTYSGKYTEIEYDHIKKIIETDNLYNLVIANGSVIMLDKREFIKGNSEECLKYIKEKVK